MIRADTPTTVRVASKIRIDPITGCWNWTAFKMKGGYGRIHVSGVKTVLAHRIAYEAYRHPIPNGLHIDHLCRNRACVNPWHMEIVTSTENTRRGLGPTAINATKTYCLRGHAYTPENTKMDRRGRRSCRACLRIKSRARSLARTPDEKARYWANRVAKRKTA